MRNYIESTLYCMNCGGKAMPIQRKAGRQKEKFHRKKLYCWHCKQEVNHIECKTPEDVEKFKIAFENGEFAEEALESLTTSQKHDIFRKREKLCLNYT